MIVVPVGELRELTTRFPAALTEYMMGCPPCKLGGSVVTLPELIVDPFGMMKPPALPPF